MQYIYLIISKRRVELMNDEKTAEQLAYELIKMEIITKKLAPGKQIIERIITNKLGISRTTARNVINRLNREGYLDLIENKGAFVIKPSLEDIGEAYDMYYELQCIALEQCTEKLMEDDLANLKRLVERERLANLSRDIEEYLSINIEFHMMLATISGNKYLIEFTKKIIDKISLFLMLYDDFYKIKPENETSIEQHEHILELLEAGNLSELKKYMKFHLNNGFMNIKQNKLEFKKLSDMY